VEADLARPRHRLTTIAYDGRTLAADSLATCHGGRVGVVVKIAERNGVFAAGVGSSARCRAFLDWFRAGMTGFPPPMGDESTAYLFPLDGQVVVVDSLGLLAERPWRYWAAGSGADYAIGAMEAGASAAEAVRIACLHDTSSGGEIITLSRSRTGIHTDSSKG
jgi:hypothetical protein